MKRRTGQVLSVAALMFAGAAVCAQVELDRIVSRVNGRIITTSDIRQARLLKLVDQSQSEESTRRALEDRLLILAELNRAAPLAPIPDPEVAARRTEWQSSLGADADVAALLRQGAMSEGDLGAWCRDDLKIRAYLKRQFGMLSEAERAKAESDWVARLRQRADLP